MNLSQKAKKAVAAGLALSTMLMGVSFLAVTPVLAAPHGEGCVVNSGGTVYLVTGGQRRGFTSAEVFASHGYNFGQVVSSNSETDALPVGPIMVYADGSLVKGPSDPLVYLVSNGQKRGFTSGSVFTGMGYSFANIQWAPENTFADLPTGSHVQTSTERHPAGTWVLDGSGTVWKMTTTGRMGLPSMAVFNSYGKSWAHIVSANAADLAAPNEGVVAARATCTLGSTPTTPTGGLNGGAGTVESYALAAGYTNEEVGESENDVIVAGLEVEAGDESDLRLTAVKLVFDEGTAASDFDQYADEVSVWLGNTKVAELDASEFNDDNDWTKTVTLSSSTIVRMGDTETLYVAVSAINNLDSGDAGDTWTVDFTQVRYVDALGASTTDTVTVDATTFSFESFSSAADIELVVSAEQDVNDARMIDVDSVADTDDVTILTFTLEAEGNSDISIDSLPVTINTVEATGNDPDDLISTYYLYNGSTLVGSESNPASDTTDDSTSIVVFEPINVTVAAGDTEEFTVRVKLLSLADALDAGDTVQAVFGETETDLATFEAEDEQGTDLVDADKTGTVTGGAHELRDIGFNVEFVDSDAVVSHQGDIANTTDSDEGTFTITFDVTAFGGDIYVDASAPSETGGSGEFDLTINGTDTLLAASVTSPSGAESAANSTYLVEEGTTETFTVTVVLQAGADGLFDVSLADIVYALTAIDGDLSFDFGLEDFKTPQIYLNNDAA